MTAGLIPDKYVIRKTCTECGGSGLVHDGRGGTGPCIDCNGHGTIPVDPNAWYFVLRPATDTHAYRACEAYATSVQQENPRLARDLRGMLANVTQANPWQSVIEALELCDPAPSSPAGALLVRLVAGKAPTAGMVALAFMQLATEAYDEAAQRAATLQGIDDTEAQRRQRHACGTLGGLPVGPRLDVLT